MSVDELTSQKSVFTNYEMPPFLFDLFCTIRNIKNTETVDSFYLSNNGNNLEIYVFYEKENFDIEDKIVKYLTDWEEQYKYFPEIFIYPLDRIENKQMSLPQNAQEY